MSKVITTLITITSIGKQTKEDTHTCAFVEVHNICLFVEVYINTYTHTHMTPCQEGAATTVHKGTKPSGDGKIFVSLFAKTCFGLVRSQTSVLADRGLDLNRRVCLVWLMIIGSKCGPLTWALAPCFLVGVWFEEWALVRMRYLMGIRYVARGPWFGL